MARRQQFRMCMRFHLLQAELTYQVGGILFILGFPARPIMIRVLGRHPTHIHERLRATFS